MNKIFIVFIIFLSSCTTTRLRMLENNGTIRTDFSSDPEYDYTVIMEGVKQFGWDGDNKDDRQNMLISMFGDRCKQLKIGDEAHANTGSKQGDHEIQTWVVKVKCLN